MKPKGWSQLKVQDKGTLKRMFNHFEARRMNRYALKECKEEIVAMALENQEHGQSFDDLFPQGLSQFSDECVENSPKELLVFVMMHYLSISMISVFLGILCLHLYYYNSNIHIELLRFQIANEIAPPIYIQMGNLYVSQPLFLQFGIVMVIYIIGFLLVSYYNLARRKLAFVILVMMCFSANVIQSLMIEANAIVYSIPVYLFYVLMGGGGFAMLLGYYLLSKQQWMKEKAKREIKE